MLIFRYLAKEVFIAVVALTSILLLIFMSNQVVIYLNRAASGVIPGMLVLKLMMLELPNLISLLLPLGYYVALLLAYGRLYADCELTVLQACGYSPNKLLMHSLLMGLVVASLTSFMMALSPKIAYERAKILQSTGVQTLIQTIVPGRFRSLSGGQQVFYVESMNRQHTMANDIFIARLLNEEGTQQWDILWANHAFLKKHDNNHLILQNGAKYQGTPGELDYQTAKFKQLQIQLPNPKLEVKNDIRAVDFSNLWPLNNPDLQKAAELQWRLSIPLMVFCLTLVAVPLSRVDSRSGKYAKILPAIVIYIIYANFMFVVRNWIVIGKIPSWIGLWWLHIVVAGLGLFLIWRNNRRLS